MLSSPTVGSRRVPAERPGERIKNLPVRLLGWVAPILYGDPTILDRWLWLRRRLRTGACRTLDAGCGTGAFSFYAARSGNEVIGLSSNERNNRVAQARARILGLSRISFLTRDLRQLHALGEELGQFDQIICCETIEHIADDRRFLASLASLLRPGGQLLLTTPSDRHRPLPGERLSPSEDGGHVRFGYSHDDLRTLFAGAGLQPVSLGYVTGAVSQLLTRVQWRIAGTSPLLGWLLIIPFRPLQLIDRFATPASGLTYFCVAAVAVRPQLGSEGVAAGSGRPAGMGWAR